MDEGGQRKKEGKGCMSSLNINNKCEDSLQIHSSTRATLVPAFLNIQDIEKGRFPERSLMSSLPSSDSLPQSPP